MATYHLAFGVVCVALVSRFVLGERLTPTQLVGFALLAVAIVLVTHRPATAEGDEKPPARAGRPAVEEASRVGVGAPRLGSSARSDPLHPLARLRGGSPRQPSCGRSVIVAATNSDVYSRTVTKAR
jgi:hypothetical protein